MPSHRYEARLLADDEFFELGQRWNDLLSRTIPSPPFLTVEWIRTWWRHFGTGQRLVAPVVFGGGELLAGVPLALRRTGPAGARVRLAEIAGTGPVPTRGMGLADKGDLVIDPSHPGAGSALIEALRGLLADVDVIALKGVDSGSEAAALLRGWPGSAALERSVSPYLTLGRSWEECLAAYSGNFRKHLRKYRRRLEQRGTLRIERLVAGQDVEPWLRRVLEVNEASWKAERGTNLLRHPGLRAFVFDLVRELSPRGGIDLHLLSVGDRPVAYELCFDHAGRVSSWEGAFHRDFADLSPGTTLTADVIRSACERGRLEYDMLRGAEGYKSRWSDGVRHELEICAPAARPISRLYVALGQRLMHRLRRSSWLVELADRCSGRLTRMRHRGQ